MKYSKFAIQLGFQAICKTICLVTVSNAQKIVFLLSSYIILTVVPGLNNKIISLSSTYQRQFDLTETKNNLKESYKIAKT